MSHVPKHKTKDNRRNLKSVAAVIFSSTEEENKLLTKI